MNVTFDFGETKHVRIEVLSRNNEPFEIFDVLLGPKKTGMYKLRFMYHIGDQTLIEELNVVVV